MKRLQSFLWIGLLVLIIGAVFFSYSAGIEINSGEMSSGDSGTIPAPGTDSGSESGGDEPVIPAPDKLPPADGQGNTIPVTPPSDGPESGTSGSDTGTPVDPQGGGVIDQGDTKPSGQIPVPSSGTAAEAPSAAENTVNASIDDLTKTITTSFDKQTPDAISDLATQIRGVDGKSALGLTAQEQVDALGKVMGLMASAQKAAQALEPQPSFFGSLVSGFMNLLSGPDVEADYLIPLTGSVEKTSLALAQVKNSLEQSLFDVFIDDFSTPLTAQESASLLADTVSYEALITTYDLDLGLKNFAQEQIRALQERLTLQQIIQSLQKSVPDILAKKSRPVDKIQELSVLYGRVARYSGSSESQDLKESINALSASIKKSLTEVVESTSKRLDELTSQKTVTDALLLEAQGLQDDVTSPLFVNAMGAKASPEIQQKADAALSHLTLLQQRKQFETLVSTIKPYDEVSQTPEEYQAIIQTALSGIEDLYDQTMYSEQSKLLESVQKALKESAGLDAVYGVLLEGPIKARIDEIKNFKKGTLEEAGLVKKLALNDKIPADQIRSILQEIRDRNYGSDGSMWPAGFKKEVLDVLADYKLPQKANEANHIQAFLTSAQLTPEERQILVAAGGFGNAAELGALQEGEFATSLSKGAQGLLARSLKEVQAGIGGNLQSIGEWLLTMGGQWRYTQALETTAQTGKTVESAMGSLGDFLSKDFIRLSLPVQLADYVEIVSTVKSVSATGGSIAESAAQKSQWADWLGSTLQAMGDALIAKGQKLSGTGIDINELIAKSKQQQQAIEEDASVKSALGSLVGSFVSAVKGMMSDLVSGASSSTKVQTARDNFENSRKEFRDFLGIDDTMSAKDFKTAFEQMVKRINYRGYSDAEGQALLKTKFILLSRKLEIASKALAHEYMSALNDSSQVLVMANDLASTSFDVEVNKAFKAGPDVTAPDVAQAAFAATGTQSALEGMLAQQMRDAVTSLKADISNGFLKASTSPFDEGSLNDYSSILSRLLITRQGDIQKSAKSVQNSLTAVVAKIEK